MDFGGHFASIFDDHFGVCFWAVFDDLNDIKSDILRIPKNTKNSFYTDFGGHLTSILRVILEGVFGRFWTVLAMYIILKSDILRRPKTTKNDPQNM